MKRVALQKCGLMLLSAEFPQQLERFKQHEKTHAAHTNKNQNQQQHHRNVEREQRHYRYQRELDSSNSHQQQAKATTPSSAMEGGAG